MASEKNNEEYEKWFESFDDSKGYMDSLNEAEKEEHRQKIYNQLNSSLDLKSEFGSFSSHKFAQNNYVKRAPYFYKIAAVILVGALLSISGLYMYNLMDEGKTGMLYKTTATGEIANFALPDGTEVWLSAASTLKYQGPDDDKKRLVQLTGEAFFDVKHHAAHPFIVQAGAIKTRVLGTSFNVKAYDEDPEIKVTLAEGSLEVTSERSTKKTVLIPDQQVAYEKRHGLRSVQEVDASLSSAWTREELVFMRESFGEIARTFERWYDVEFVFEDASIKEEVFVYHFKEHSLKNSMQVLSELADFEYEINNNQIFIRSVDN